MLLKGDKIKLVKEISGFNKVGETFEVSEILDGGMISFKCCFGTGLMSYDEYEKHFEKITIRQWGQWSGVDFKDEGETIVLNSNQYHQYYYRTNGKKIELKLGNKKISASCNDCDKFDLIKGLQLCYARMRVKEIIENM